MIIITITLKDFIPSPTDITTSVRTFGTTFPISRQRLNILKQQGIILQLRAVCSITHVACGYERCHH